MEQAWLRSTDAEVNAVQQAFDELALDVRGLTSRTSPDAWQAFTLSLKDEFLRGLGSYERHREFETSNDHLREALGAVEDLESLREEACTGLLSWVKALHRRLRERLVAELDERAAKALELGEWVDRGGRPENVHRSMRVKLTLDTFPAVESPWQETKEVAQVDEHNYLAERAVECGEVPPDSFWPKQVKRLCAGLRFTEEQMQSVLQRLETMEPGKQAFTVEKVEEEIRRALACSGELPSWLRVDLARCVVYVDDVPHPVDDPDLALFVQQVAARRGASVSVNQLGAEVPRLKGFRPDKSMRQTRHHFLKQLIKGSKLGYRLTRPDHG